MIVKIFGERNTGTRAMAALIRQVPGVSFRVGPRPEPADGALEAAIETQLRGPWKKLYFHALRDAEAARLSTHDPWKHAVPRLTQDLRAAAVRTILMVRDPYSWLIGLARRPYHIKGPNAETLEGFAARPWMTEQREGLPAVLPSPVDLWSAKVAGSLAYRDAAQAAGLPVALIRFEDFVADPLAAATRAARELALPEAAFRPREANTKTGEAGLPTLQTYYRTEAWAAWLTAPALRRINARLDPGHLSTLGYGLRAPETAPGRLEPAVEAAMRAEMASLRTPAHTTDNAG